VLIARFQFGGSGIIPCLLTHGKVAALRSIGPKRRSAPTRVGGTRVISFSAALLANRHQGNAMSKIANTPKPPYYAVIFTSVRTEGDNGYAEAAARILEIARQQPGFLGYEAARTDVGVSVSYWESLEAIKAWKEHPEHKKVQAKEQLWYGENKIRISKVERDY
jgi:heme-degrading monooxygenase HmoA